MHRACNRSTAPGGGKVRKATRAVLSIPFGMFFILSGLKPKGRPCCRRTGGIAWSQPLLTDRTDDRSLPDDLDLLGK